MVELKRCDEPSRVAYLKSAIMTQHPGNAAVELWLNAPVEKLKRDMDMLKEESRQNREWMNKRLQRYVSSFTIPVDHLRVMVQSFVHELTVGLECHKAHPLDFVPSECSFKMLDACIKSLPTGHEKGIFYALDFGGTNFRAVRVHLQGDGKLSVRQKRASLLSAPGVTHEKGLMDCKATATQMFDFFAKMVQDFMAEEGDLDCTKQRQCGFTFSFPCAQRHIDSALLMNWTKSFETGRTGDDPVEHRDVAELMNVAFVRNGVPMVCNSILNDTVGTLLSCAYEMEHSKHPPCLVGMILGTGMNCCYVDESARWYGYAGNVVNIECGNFNRDLPRTNIDCELDFIAVANRGLQQIEKMCSGAYLGEIARMSFVKVLQHEVPVPVWKPGSFGTDKLAAAVVDQTEDLSITCEAARQAWGVDLNRSQLHVLQQLCIAVMDRSAALAAVLISGCAQKTGRLQPAFGGVSVAIDGSLYKMNPWYRGRVSHYLEAILGANLASHVHTLIADDGSGKGAGILAGTLASSRKVV